MLSRVGDVLAAINGEDVTTMCEEELEHLIATTSPGSSVTTVCQEELEHLIATTSPAPG